MLPTAHAPLIDFLGSNEGPNEIDITLLEAKLFELASMIGAEQRSPSACRPTLPMFHLDCTTLLLSICTLCSSSYNAWLYLNPISS
jgi:hypothetical protein